MASVLETIKKPLGLAPDYTAFDADIIMHINTAFISLNQLGVGPSIPFSISDNTATWEEFIGDNPYLKAAETYVYLKVRLLFDPPTNSFLIEAFERQIAQLEFNLFVEADPAYVPPAPPEE